MISWRKYQMIYRYNMPKVKGGKHKCILRKESNDDKERLTRFFLVQFQM